MPLGGCAIVMRVDEETFVPVPQQETCPHRRRRLIAKDQDAEYVECLDCGALHEKEELTEPSGFDESLSDA